MSSEEPIEISDFEKDSLYLLPLAMIPLESKALSRARLVKNAKLQSMLEVFEGSGSGSGQINPDMIEQSFDIAQNPGGNDVATVRALAGLNSFDVYSLRIAIRNIGIEVEDQAFLRLSDTKRAELTKYMLGFTRPLLRQIYGNEETNVSDISELIALFDNPNREEALRNLKNITDKLQIELGALPRFLEDYGDTFLSLAYFQDCHFSLEPQFRSFTTAVDNIQDNHQLRQNSSLMKSLDQTVDDLEDVKASLEGLFQSFDRETRTMWEDFNADTFSKVQRMIENNHTTIGAVLCGLSVKMGAWTDRFGTADHGLIQQSEFIMSDIRQGLDILLEITQQGTPREKVWRNDDIIDF